MNFSDLSNGWSTNSKYADFGNPFAQSLFADDSVPAQAPGSAAVNPEIDPATGLPMGQDVMVTANRQAPAAAAPVAVDAPVAVPLPPAVRQPVRVLNPDGRSQEEYDHANDGIKAKKPGFLQKMFGFIGDAYLVGQGQHPIFKEKQDRLKQGAATFGATTSPQEAKNSIERLRALGYVDEAEKMQQTLDQTLIKQQGQQSLMDNRAALTADRQYKMRQDVGNYAARLAGAARTPEQLAIAKDVIYNRLLAAHIEPEDVFGPEGMAGITMENKDLLGQGDMTVMQQQTLPLQQQRTQNDTDRVGIARETLAQRAQLAREAEAGRMKRDHPPARNAPQPTAAAMAQPIMDLIGKVGWDKVPKPLQDKARALGFDPDRGSGKKKRTIPPLPPGF